MSSDKPPLGSFLHLKKRSRCRANGAENISPGQRPGERIPISLSALKGRRGHPAPFQGAPLLFPAPRALPWASICRRFQRRKLLSGVLILFQQGIDGAHDFRRLPVLGTYDLAREAALAIDQIRFGKHGRAVMRCSFFRGVVICGKHNMIVC